MSNGDEVPALQQIMQTMQTLQQANEEYRGIKTAFAKRPEPTNNVSWKRPEPIRNIS